MSVMIGVPTGDMARNAEFYDHFNLMNKPAGTGISFAHGQSPARNRNLIIEQALANNFTHVFFLDDDVAFKPDILDKLLVHDVDVVTAFHLMRNYPHRPIIFDYADSEGKCKHHYPSSEETGLIPIVACGLGACLIKIEVFKALEKPWIRLGELEKDHWCDDIGFFRRVREAGFKMFCDLDVPLGHFASVKVWPNKVNGKWHTIYDSNGPGQVSFPMVTPNGTD